MKWIKLMLVSSFMFTLSGCLKDLEPTNDKTAEEIYVSLDGYKSGLAKVYGASALTGNQGPTGNGDIQGFDEGFSDFFRLFWTLQELPTDEAVNAWGDAGLPDFHQMNWSSANPFILGIYYRTFYQIALANEFIRQSQPSLVSSRGLSSPDATQVATFQAEVRFLRAFQYWVAMDLFGNVPFADENNIPGSFLPEQIDRDQIFQYIEAELKALETLVPAPRTNEYGRVDQAAVWALLARLYLNAEVYTGEARWNDALTYSKKVIDAGYTLIPKYSDLGVADNNVNNTEFILPINYDGIRTQNWGGSTFLIHASIGGSASPADFGIDFGWGGNRTTSAIYNLFPDADGRKLFYTNGQNTEITSIAKFTDGIGVKKFTNKKKDGTNGSSLTWTDTDVPLFRLAEMYLIYAEATVRSGNLANAPTAINYINLLRTRAYGNTTGNITGAEFLTPASALKFIMDERARELYWEGHRRTDLVRFGLFTSAAYLWPWKGNISNGTSVDAFRNVYPIPSSEISANTNLKQNTGY